MRLGARAAHGFLTRVRDTQRVERVFVGTEWERAAGASPWRSRRRTRKSRRRVASSALRMGTTPGGDCAPGVSGDAGGPDNPGGLAGGVAPKVGAVSRAAGRGGMLRRAGAAEKR